MSDIHLLNFQKSDLHSFVFFNDGDDTPNFNKKIGKTAGIYTQKATKIEQLLGLFELVKSKGNGGDAPENDVEAIIEGIKRFPEAKQVVLIADNLSCIRDIRLADKISLPVKVVLCGYNETIGANPHYVELAARTGGSVHTAEQDIENLTVALSKKEDIFQLKNENKETVLTIRENCSLFHVARVVKFLEHRAETVDRRHIFLAFKVISADQHFLACQLVLGDPHLLFGVFDVHAFRIACDDLIHGPIGIRGHLLVTRHVGDLAEVGHSNQIKRVGRLGVGRIQGGKALAACNGFRVIALSIRDERVHHDRFLGKRRIGVLPVDLFEFLAGFGEITRINVGQSFVVGFVGWLSRIQIGADISILRTGRQHQDCSKGRKNCASPGLQSLAARMIKRI